MSVLVTAVGKSLRECCWKQRSQMLLLTIAVCAAAYAGATVGPLQEVIRSSLRFGDNEMALLQGPAMGLPMVMAAIPLGLAVDRYVRVRLVMALALCDLAGTVLTAIAPGFWSLTFARGIIGLSSTAVNPIALSLISDLYPPTQRGRATMAMGIAQTGGVAVAFAAGGLALRADVTGNWRTAMLILAIPLGAVFMLTLAMREPPRTDVLEAQGSLKGTFAELWRFRRTIVPLLSGTVLALVASGAVLVWGAPALSRRFSLAPDRVGTIIAVVMIVSGLVGPALGGVLADLCQRHGGPHRTTRVLAFVTLLAVPAGLFGDVNDADTACILLISFSTIIAASCVIGTTQFTIAIPNELRGLCMGIFAASSVLFNVAIAPVLVSELSQLFPGPQGISIALSSVCICSAIAASAVFGLAVREGATRTV